MRITHDHPRLVFPNWELKIAGSCQTTQRKSMKSQSSFRLGGFTMVYMVLGDFVQIKGEFISTLPGFQRCTDHMGHGTGKIDEIVGNMAVSDNGVYHPIDQLAI